MVETLRKVLAVALSVGIISGAFPAAALANGPGQAKGVSRGEAEKFFRDNKILSGDDDPLYGYLFSGGELTMVGKLVLQDLKARPNVREEVEGMAEALKTLRESGPYDRQKAKRVERMLEQYDQEFGSISGPTHSGEDMFRSGTLREAAMTGASFVDPAKGSDNSNFVQRDMPDADGDGRPDGFEFYDKNGLAFRLNKHQVPVFSRDVLNAQKQMNQTGAPMFVPETGQYNIQMLEYSQWLVGDQQEKYSAALKVDRAVLIAQMLGEYYKDDQFQSKATQDLLEQKALKKSWSHEGKSYTLKNVVDARTQARTDYLKAAEAGVTDFKAEIEALRKKAEAQGQQASISDGEIQNMQLHEQYVRRYLNLAFLESQKYAIVTQIESLDTKSPDHEAVEKAIKDAPIKHEDKVAHGKQLNKLQKESERFLRIIAHQRELLLKKDYAEDLDVVSAALNSLQKETGDLGVKYALAVEGPSQAWIAKEQTSLGLGTWAAKLVQKTGIMGDEHTKAMDEVERKLPFYIQITEAVSKGDYAKARELAIQMDPGAAATHRQMGLDNAPGRILDNDRINAAMRKMREETTRVAAVNQKVNAAGNLVTWTVGLAAGAPLVSWTASSFARGFAWAALKTQNIPVVGFAFNALEKTLTHVSARLNSLNGSESKLYWSKSLHNAARRRWGFGLGTRLTGKALRSGERFIVRGWNAGWRQASFTGLSAGISGAYTMGDHMLSKDSMYGGKWEAFSEGAVGGAVWANESWHPLLGYVGLPSNVFEGTALNGVAEVIGVKGVVGTARHAAFKFFGASAKTTEKWGLEALSEWGAWKAGTQFFSKAGMAAAGRWAVAKPAAFILGTADNVAKYFLFSEAIGRYARYATYRDSYSKDPISYYDEDSKTYEYDEVDDEGKPILGADGKARKISVAEKDALYVSRRVRASENAKIYWMEAPLWLLLPTYPATNEAGSNDFLAGKQGLEEYAAKLHEVINAPKDGKLPMSQLKIPLSQKIFNMRWRGTDANQEFTVTDAIRAEAIEMYIVRRLAGGKKGAKPSDINPYEFYKLAKTPEKGMVGDAYMRDEIRIQAMEYFNMALAKNPSIAKAVLLAKNGAKVPEFGGGRATPEMKRDVAAALLMQKDLLKRAKVGDDGKLKLPVKDNETITLAFEKLRAHLESSGLPRPKAVKFLELIRTLEEAKFTKGANGKRQKVETALDKAVDEIFVELQKWKADGGKDYVSFVNRMRKAMKAKLDQGVLNASEHKAMDAAFDYIDAIEARFNSFNKVEVAYKLSQEVLEAKLLEYSETPGGDKIVARLKEFRKALDGWRRGKDGKAKAVDFGAPSGDKKNPTFRDMIAEMKKSITGEAKSKKISASEKDALEAAVNEMDAAPWVLHDSKGSPLPSWRAVQFEGLMTALGLIMKDARGSAPIRQFIKLKTGGGKTMLTFEGLLPLAEADAAFHSGFKAGLRGLASVKNPIGGYQESGMQGVKDSLPDLGQFGESEVLFLTVQANLDAQARLEFMAYKNLSSKLKFETYEGFKTKLAEGKMYYKDAAKKTWILGDEIDGAALQPMLTIGEITASIPRYGSGTELLDTLSDNLDLALSNRWMTTAKELATQVRRLQAAAEKIDAATAQGQAARRNAETMLEAVESLATATRADQQAVSLKRLETALAAQRKALGGGEAAPEILTGFGKGLEKLSKLGVRIENAKTPAQRAKLMKEAGELLVAQERLLDTGVTASRGERGADRKGSKQKKEADGASGIGKTQQGRALKRALETLRSQLGEAQAAGREAAVRRALAAQRQILNEINVQNPKDLAAHGKTVEKIRQAAEKLQALEEFAGLSPKERTAQAKRFEKSVVESFKKEGFTGAAEKLLAQQKKLMKAKGFGETRHGQDLARVFENLEIQTSKPFEPGKLIAEYVAETRRSLDAAPANPSDLAALSEAVEGVAAKLKDFGAESANPAAGALAKQARRILAEQDVILSRTQDNASARAKLRGIREKVQNRYDQTLKEKSPEIYEDVMAARKEGKDASALEARADAQHFELARLKQQMATLEKLGGEQGPVERLRTKAQSLKDQARRKHESLAKSNKALTEKIETAKKEGRETEAMEAEAKLNAETLSRLQQEIALLERFETGAPSPKYEKGVERAEQRKALKAHRDGLKAKREALAKERAEISTEITRLGGGQKAAKEARLKEIDAEIAGVTKELKTRQELDAVNFVDHFNALDAFAETGRELVKLIKEGKPGSETRARELLALRRQLIKAFTHAETDVYVTYRQMQADMYEWAMDKDRMSADDAVADAAVKRMEAALDGLPLRRLIPLWAGRKISNGWNRLIGNKDGVKTFTAEELGLVRERALDLLAALKENPFMPASQRQELFWSIVPSVLWPRGPTGKGQSWVRTEMINMARGYHEDPATMRFDNLTGKVDVIHNGQWFETMDNPGRRFWEIEYGSDLTLPYRHRHMSTIKDITTNQKSRFITVSGSDGETFAGHMTGEGRVSVGGTGSTPPKGQRLDIRRGEASKLSAAEEAMTRVLANSKKRVVVSPQAAETPKEVRAYLKKLGLEKKDTVILEIGDAPAGVRKHLQAIKAAQGDSALTVLSLSDTRILKKLRKQLVKRGVLKADEIAQVFSDSEYLRLNRPQARVHEQMNLSGLNNGRVKLLLLDTRVGGRGLDLNFKGNRDPLDASGFKGYTDFEMLIVDPNAMSQVHQLQAFGRIDTDRRLPGAKADYSLVLDVSLAKRDLEFQHMARNEFFTKLRNNAEYREFAKKRSADVSSWKTVHEFMGTRDPLAQKELIASYEAAKADVFVRLMQDAQYRAFAQKNGLEATDWSTYHDYVTAKGDKALVEEYTAAVERALRKRQLEVERDQLRSSGVLKDPAPFNPRFRGLELAH